jgi:chromosome partitioning protein
MIEMSKIYSVASAKGGVGKTTTSINLGAALAEFGNRVLLIDNDPERHLSNSLGIAATKYSISTLMSAVLNDMELDDLLPSCIVTAGKLDCIPSSPALAGMASQLTIKQNSVQMFTDSTGAVKSEYVLKQITDHIGGRYDYIVIDCGRSLDMLTINALVAAQSVIIPVQAHYLPEEGLGSFLETIEKIRTNLNPTLEIAGILITMYQVATNLCRSVRQDVTERFGSDYRVFSQPIMHSIKVAEAPAFKQSIFEYDSANKAAQGYLTMAKELLENVKA